MENQTLSKLILASKSPVRRLLLQNCGLKFEIQTADIDEKKVTFQALEQTSDQTAICEILAVEKALKISRVRPNDFIIGADQTLEFENKFFNKPQTLVQAKEQLLSLRGKTHVLRSAVALARDGKILWQASDSAELTMINFSDAELEGLLNREGDSLLSTVGSYRLEGPALQLFESVVGDYFTVLGLPIFKLITGLRQHAPHFLLGASNDDA